MHPAAIALLISVTPSKCQLCTWVCSQPLQYLPETWMSSCFYHSCPPAEAFPSYFIFCFQTVQDLALLGLLSSFFAFSWFVPPPSVQFSFRFSVLLFHPPSFSLSLVFVSTFLAHTQSLFIPQPLYGWPIWSSAVCISDLSRKTSFSVCLTP